MPNPRENDFLGKAKERKFYACRTVTRFVRERNSVNELGIAEFGVPYGSRTRVAAVKEKRPGVIQANLAAWIALYRN